MAGRDRLGTDRGFTGNLPPPESRRTVSTPGSAESARAFGSPSPVRQIEQPLAVRAATHNRTETVNLSDLFTSDFAEAFWANFVASGIIAVAARFLDRIGELQPHIDEALARVDHELERLHPRA